MRRRVEIKQASGTREILTASGTQETVVADLGEAAREHVLEKARNERVHRERHAPCLLGARMGVAKRDAGVLEPFERMVAEGDAIDVAREIARGVVTAPDLLDMERR